jgi:hypothetical protein
VLAAGGGGNITIASLVLLNSDYGFTPLAIAARASGAGCSTGASVALEVREFPLSGGGGEYADAVNVP